MAISRITTQDAQADSASSPISATYPAATTAGNLLIAVVTSNSAITTLSGWTLAQVCLSNGQNFSIYYKNASGSETTISFVSTGSTFASIDIFEYAGSANPVAIDISSTVNGGSGNTTSRSTPTITTSYTSTLIFSVVVSNSSLAGCTWARSTSIGANTGGGIGNSIHCGELIVSTRQLNFNDTASWTTGSATGLSITVFQATDGLLHRPTVFNNYQQFSVGNGMSVSEKIR